MNNSFDDQNNVLLKENNKLKEQIEIKNRELDKLEHVLLANLAHKEQEIADLSAQIDDMKASSNPCNQQLRCMGLDPAVNAVFLRIKKDMKAANEKLEQTQNDLQAWKFTPDSQTGKRMMTRMRVLLQENEELGKINQSGRTAKLESEIAMKRTLIEELKQTNSDYENVIDEMDTETDCFQTSIFVLQQQLSIARTTISRLCTEIELLAPGHSQPILTKCNWSDPSVLNKSEPMDGVVNQLQLMSSSSSLSSVSSSSVKSDPDSLTAISKLSSSSLLLCAQSNCNSLSDTNSKLLLIDDNRTRHCGDEMTSNKSTSVTGGHNRISECKSSTFESNSLKCEPIDSDSHSAVVLSSLSSSARHKHSSSSTGSKSNSERNQKKLTSS